MSLTTFGIVFIIGLAVSLRFTMLVLFPATILATIGIAALGDSIKGVMLTMVLVPMALQVGYLVGVAFFATLASSGMTRRAAAFAHSWRQHAEGLQSVK
jgi:hypothetical protein